MEIDWSFRFTVGSITGVDLHLLLFASLLSRPLSMYLQARDIRRGVML